MKTFSREYTIPKLNSPIFDQYFGDKKLCVFDIETTGLSRATSKVILTALLVQTANGVKVTQFLAENSYEENRVVDATLDFLETEGIDYLVTYNGNSFDVPFFNARCNVLNSERRLKLYNLDMYSFISRNTTLPDKLDSLSQKSVERFYKIGNLRKDTITGKESVKLYREYMMHADPIIEKVILTHNREDVIQLYKILLNASYRDFEAILKGDDLHEVFSRFGFPACERFVLRTRVNESKQRLIINGDQLQSAMGIEVFREANEPSTYSAHFNSALKNLSVEVILDNYGNDLFVNTKTLGVSEDLQGLDAYVNGFLIIKANDIIDYSAVNRLAEALVERITSSYC